MKPCRWQHSGICLPLLGGIRGGLVQCLLTHPTLRASIPRLDCDDDETQNRHKDDEGVELGPTILEVFQPFTREYR